MGRNRNMKPIGLAAPCAEIAATCAKAHVYRRCGLKPSHLIIPLDAGSGRTTFVEYMAGMYKEYGVLGFASGLDDYIEITLDGTLQQLKQAFASVDSAAIYANNYCGIVAIDISSIALHLNETQLAEFLANCKRICTHACVIFFVHSTPSKGEERLMEKLCENVDNIKCLEVEPYTVSDILALVIKNLADRGIAIRHAPLFRRGLLDVIVGFHIADVRGAVTLSNALVHFADFSGFTPAVDESSLVALTEIRHNETERSEIK